MLPLYLLRVQGDTPYEEGGVGFLRKINLRACNSMLNKKPM